MQKYSEIIVIDSGKIAERGSFDEPMERKEAFCRLHSFLDQ